MNFTPLKTLRRTALTLAASALIITPALAHDIYIWPSYFNINAEKPTHVAVDVTASHTAFRPDFAMASNGVKVTGVDGKALRRFGPYYQGQRRASFDLPVNEAGTYGLFYQREASYFTKYKIGKRDKDKHMRANKVEAAAKLPKGARDIETRSYATTAMSFVTNQAPTTEALAPTNQGFELIAITHPSDYVTNEALQVKALFNGEPVADQTIIIEQEGPQYRKNPEALEIKTNKEGIASFTLSNGGRYLLKTNHEKVATNELADFDVTRIFYAFEVIFE
ncbi:DUF4198 domain-containing protein [Colwellia sp. D2M02]|uniref:DUF4198 domain-containing protein n=1 Tax=Colwellia sp. D2M02 TaxID=2841562 RepID=UPI001C08C132|nr:DUF4198 domain-containing protein [Colwellia sp. D2M02]MBU2891836.1 DUF4198 domain-containing protein [Colwellia sp. D2M02]